MSEETCQETGRASALLRSRKRLAPAERVPQILEAAVEEFTERGYGAARMAAVAERAGIAKGLIYHYFPSKENLFRAVVRSCTQPVFEAAEQRVAQPAGSARQTLADLITLGYGRVCSDRRERALFRLILIEAERFPELSAFYREEVFGRAVALVRAVLRAGAETGEFRPEVTDTPGLPEVVLAPMVAAGVWTMIMGEEEAPAMRMPLPHLELLLAGLAGRG